MLSSSSLTSLKPPSQSCLKRWKQQPRLVERAVKLVKEVEGAWLRPLIAQGAHFVVSAVQCPILELLLECEKTPTLQGVGAFRHTWRTTRKPSCASGMDAGLAAAMIWRRSRPCA